MAQVKAKKHNSGYVLGVEFVNGVAETSSPAALAFFRQSEDFDVVEKAKAKAGAANSDN